MRYEPATFGIVTTQRQAGRILTAIEGAGLSRDDVSVLFAGDAGGAGDEGEAIPGSGSRSAGATSAPGDASVLRAAAGVVAVPGDGPFIASGPILNALNGGLIGAGSSSIAAALLGMGIPDAGHYEEQIRGGRVLIAVHVTAPEERAFFEAIFAEGGGADIFSGGEGTAPSQPPSAPWPLS